MRMFLFRFEGPCWGAATIEATARYGNLTSCSGIGEWQTAMQHRPLFVPLCEGFVDNVALILRVALACGAIVFVQELGDVRERFAPREHDTAPPQATAEEPPVQPDPAAHDDEPWLSDGVRHALNYTHTEYRNRHYDECVQEPTDVYRRPAGETEDDIGFIARDDAVLYARLDPAAN
jgi:hypothetical protein